MKRSTWSRFIQRVPLIAALALSALGGAQAAPAPAGCPMTPVGQVPLVKTGLPVVEVWTNANAPILDRETYVLGCMRITDGTTQAYKTGLYQGVTEIRGRGNSSWDMPKKSYKLKLAKPGAAILNMPADREWVLLANYADKTLLRGDVGFELSRRLGMAWTPRLRHVELYLNGGYLGSYQIGESVKQAPSRLNITAMKATDIAQPNVSGGYLAEADFLAYTTPTDIITYTSSGILFNLKEPGSFAPEQFNHISAELQKLETTLLSNNFNPTTGYPSMIDVDTFIDWWIVKELVKDIDGPFYSSVYIYKDRGGKFKMGPVWDFDLSSGNAYYPDPANPTGWRIRTLSTWYAALFRDPAFRLRAYNRWKAVKAQHIDTLPAFIDKNAAALDASQRQNFTRWKILGVYVWPNNVVTGSYAGEVNYLKNWLNTRIRWIDANLRP